MNRSSILKECLAPLTKSRVIKRLGLPGSNSLGLGVELSGGGLITGVLFSPGDVTGGIVFGSLGVSREFDRAVSFGISTEGVANVPSPTCCCGRSDIEVDVCVAEGESSPVGSVILR